VGYIDHIPFREICQGEVFFVVFSREDHRQHRPDALRETPPAEQTIDFSELIMLFTR
jgi:hypothetical protein